MSMKVCQISLCVGLCLAKTITLCQMPMLRINDPKEKVRTEVTM